MEGLVNYSSEDEQDEYPYTKVAIRERGSGVDSSSGRTAVDVSGSLKRSYEHSRSGSCERDISPGRKGRDADSGRYRSGNANNYNEDKYKIDRRTDKSRDHRDKRDHRESRNARDVREDTRDYDNHKYDYKKHDDHKRFRDSKREYKRDNSDYYRDDNKRYNRYDDRKSSYSNDHKDRFNNSKSRYDDRKQYDDRFNDERRGGGGAGVGGGGSVNNYEDRRRDFNDRRNYDDDRKNDRRSNDERRTQRSYNEDRSNAYRPRRSNSPAPLQRNNSNNKHSERKDDNGRRERERKRYSRSRSRSRSHSADNTVDTNFAPNNNTNIRTEVGELLAETKGSQEDSQVSEKKVLPTARNFEALLSLPLSETAPKHPNVVTVPAASAAAGSNITTATVQLPSYYNPNVINPNKYVEQMQKRKLIWGAKKSEDSASKWGHAQFSQDQDGKVASKFMRLMGIKNANTSADSSNTNDNEKKSPSSSTTPPNNTDVKSREAMFSTMEQQYEVARQVTHTMRGVGLGFGSQPRPY
ncbi:uncharacterized protein ACRADG_006550 [Cochliomyia hominivorax]